MHVRLLQRFATWFASTAGVWQTAAIVLLWWILESANVITIAAPSTGSVQAAPLIDGAASPNVALLPGGAKHSVNLVFDGLNWQVVSVR